MPCMYAEQNLFEHEYATKPHALEFQKSSAPTIFAPQSLNYFFVSENRQIRQNGRQRE